MSRGQMANEVQREYVKSMGSALGNVFFELRNQCVMLHWKWQEYVALFGTKPQRIELLNEAAGAFFWIVQDTLWDDVLLRIARLTDPPQSAGKDNLSLRSLPLLVATTFRGQVDTILQECLSKSAFARDWRNRRIAHTDLVPATDMMNAKPLAPASRQHVKDALHVMVQLLNAVQLHYMASESMYELYTPRNAESLLCVLRDGLHADARRTERLKSGNCGITRTIADGGMLADSAKLSALKLPSVTRVSMTVSLFKNQMFPDGDLLDCDHC